MGVGGVGHDGQGHLLRGNRLVGTAGCMKECEIRRAGPTKTKQVSKAKTCVHGNISDPNLSLTFLVLDLVLGVFDGVRGLDLQGDGPAGQRLHKDLRTNGVVKMVGMQRQVIGKWLKKLDEEQRTKALCAEQFPRSHNEDGLKTDSHACFTCILLKFLGNRLGFARLHGLTTLA